MSRAGEEDDDEEGFHDSLDRLLSSSNTSCSCSHSNSEDEDPNCNYCPEPVPRFPMGLSNKYDVWIAQPSSVEERRIRLLRQMGLTKDPSLLRHRPSLSSSGCSPDLFKRSASSDHLNTSESSSNIHNNSLTLNNINSDYDSSSNTNGILSGIVRSKSDGGGNSCKSLEFHIINSNSSSPGKEGIIGTGLPVKTDNQNNSQSHSDVEKSSNGSPMISAKTPNMPPKREIREDSMCNGSFSSSLTIPRNGESEEGLECNKLNTVNGVYVIKNLDNGKEFVVKEVREDGMWKKIKEVGTGRQLTMEEFTAEMCVGTSPIVQELMRRQNVEDRINDGLDSNAEGNCETGCKLKRGSWLKSIKNMTSTVTGHKERRSSDERDTSSEKGGRRSSSATDDSQDVSFHVPERVRIRQYGKSVKELTGLYKIQEIQAHRGSIWTIKFSLDGKYLATAGEDCVIHVWQVVGSERKGDLLLEKIEDGNFNLQFLANGSPEPSSMTPNLDNFSEKKRRGKSSINRKSASLEQILVPETVFALLEKPICSFQGHLNDVLDLSWSKSQQLLSSSMDKTVRLWDLSSNSCLKIFAHSDYVTCIQFNPVDDRYFISGSLDAKVRIWSIPDHQVVDWNDLHEMVTAACYTPDGQGALVGSYKGSCCLYNTSDNKFQQKSQIDLLNKKKSHQKKITGFQFAPGSTSEVLITSGDSRVRVIEGIDLVHKFKDNKFQQKSQIDLLNKKKSHQKKITGFQFAPGSTSEVLITSGDSRVQDKEGIDLVHKFKGFRNTNSQISASLTTNGKYVISASEDSYVYIWRHEGESRPNRNKGVTVTHSYEHFHCQDVSVAIPWPGMRDSWELHDTCFRVQSSSIDNFEEVLTANHPPTPVEEPNDGESSPFASVNSSPLNGMISSDTNSYLFDRFSVMWSEDKFISATKNTSPQVDADLSNWLSQNRSAWGMVIVTAGLRGEIRTFQNFGLPLRN